MRAAGDIAQATLGLRDLRHKPLLLGLRLTTRGDIRVDTDTSGDVAPRVPQGKRIGNDGFARRVPHDFGDPFQTGHRVSQQHFRNQQSGVFASVFTRDHGPERLSRHLRLRPREKRFRGPIPIDDASAIVVGKAGDRNGLKELGVPVRQTRYRRRLSRLLVFHGPQRVRDVKAPKQRESKNRDSHAEKDRGAPVQDDRVPIQLARQCVQGVDKSLRFRPIHQF